MKLDHVSISSGEDSDREHLSGQQTAQSIAQDEIFDDWINDTLRNGGFDKLRTDISTDLKNDEELSMRGLAAKQESAAIITNPRDYQLELFERAKKENLIAVLDTGAGKTLIAVLLIRWLLEQEAASRQGGAAHRVIFFLVPSVNLVFQQKAVLDSNLAYPMEGLYGAMNVDTWSLEYWQKTIDENRIIVCTAEILRKCLDKQYISMKQISMLIFDEAHHAKQNHAYALIMREHYHHMSEAESRPRIFGMTASPIGAKADVANGASHLESLLDSRIVTTGVSSLESLRRPEEINLYYVSSANGWGSELAKDMTSQVHDFPLIQDQYMRVERMASQLGDWCADRSMLYFLSAKSQEERWKTLCGGKKAGRQHTAIDRVNHDVRAQYEAFFKRLCDEHTVSTDMSANSVWSNKVEALRSVLESEFRHADSNRCLVFVQEKSTARLLNRLFDTIGSSNIRCGHLVGVNKGSFEEDRQSFREQMLTLSRFRRGELNVLFATSVAEEGLDVPLCNLVIRFDLYNSMIQYIQSRGRARQSLSKFIHMIDKNDPKQQQQRDDVQAEEFRMRAWCQNLPADRRLLSDESILDQMLSSEKKNRKYTNPKTGAKLNYSNSLDTLQHFLAVWPLEPGDEPYPTFAPLFGDQGFMYEVMMPASSPVRSAIGRAKSRKLLARQSAAFEMCIALFERGHLDDYFLPTRARQAHAEQGAQLAVEDKAVTPYPMKIKPSVWARDRGLQPQKLWSVLINFPAGLDHPCRSLVMLTRSPMPVFPSFPLWRNDGQQSEVCLTTLKEHIEVSKDQLEKLAAFTFLVFKDVFSKTYEAQPEQLSYFLAPAIEMMGSHDRTAIAWDLLDEVSPDNTACKWKPTSDSNSLTGKVLIDPFDGGRKFVIHTEHSSLTPQSAVPDDAVKYRWNKSILDYSVAVNKASRDKYTWTQNQPVMEARLLHLRRNMLKPASINETNVNDKAYICPEPMEISRLPTSVFGSCLAWPSIIWRVEATLIALEVCDHVGVECVPALALAAVTKDTEHLADADDEARISHTGMGENYERLEFLGDCFLKLATTIAVFVQLPNAAEEESHVERMLMLCNKNLHRNSNELGLHQFIRTKAFSRRLWYPEGLRLLKGKGAGTSNDKLFHTQQHMLGDKTIADVSEALIGAAWLTHNDPNAWQPHQWRNAITAVTKLANAEANLHTMTSWQAYVDTYQLPEYQTRQPEAYQQEMVETLQRAHDYHFKSATLLRSAFTHASQPLSREKLPHYERLEFLGDALLDMACISHLFYQYPNKGPQWLTEAKMMMVGNDFYGFLACKLGFHKSIVSSSSAIEYAIRSYYTEYTEQTTDNYQRDVWLQLSSPPKCLADLVEAYVGAMFIDSGFDYGQVQRFFDQHIKWYFEDMHIYEGKGKGRPVTEVFHLLQVDMRCRAFKLITKEAPATSLLARKEVIVGLMIHNEVVAFSKGVSARYAGDRVARNAKHTLQDLTREQFREKYKCNCVCKRDAMAMEETLSL